MIFDFRVYERVLEAASATFSPFQLNCTSHLGVVNGQRPAASLRCGSIPRNYSGDFLMNGSEVQQPRSISLQNPISLRTKASVSVYRIIGMVGAIRDYSANGKGLLLWTHPDSQGWRPGCSRINSPTIRVTRYRNGLQCRLPPSINFDTNS
jgi:hypothetical protein